LILAEIFPKGLRAFTQFVLERKLFLQFILPHLRESSSGAGQLRIFWPSKKGKTTGNGGDGKLDESHGAASVAGMVNQP